MIRKAALVGCSKGPWVAIQGIPTPHIRIKGEPGTLVGINYPDQSQAGPFKPGTHAIKRSNFISLFVVDGDAALVLCDIVSEKVA